MASRLHPGGYLDAAADREVVYCHACSHEWHRDDHGLRCPACESDITEIVSPNNDPREHGHLSSAPSSPGSRAARLDDSDPDEADIEEYAGPHGFIHRRSVRDGAEHAHHHNPGLDPVLRRFTEMVRSFGPEPNTNPRVHPDYDDGESPALPRNYLTTFTPGPFGGGTASITIFSSPAPGAHGMGHSPDGSQADPFQAILSSVLRDLGPPPAGHQGTPPPNFARGLQEIMGLLVGGNAMEGDAVYSQEALDVVITQLMEVNPQSNAAPPASEEALETLDRKTVNQSMLGGESIECTICIDEMHVGDEAVILACKHWFHEDCITLWLKEHNTCPVCRGPVEPGNGGSRNSNNTSGDGASSAGVPRPVPLQGVSPAPGLGGEAAGSSRSFRGGSGRSSGGVLGGQERESAEASAGNAPRPLLRARPARLDEALRAISTIQEMRARDNERLTSSQQSYDTSRMQRRTSISPTSPREAMSGDYGARMRQRSPSQSSRRGQGDQGSGRQASQGPISWLRERFTGGNGSHQGSSREERR